MTCDDQLLSVSKPAQELEAGQRGTDVIEVYAPEEDACAAVLNPDRSGPEYAL